MNPCIYVGFENVNVCPVFREMNTLFEFIFTFPNWAKEFWGEGGIGLLGLGAGVGVGVGAGVGDGAGAVDLQTEGCPLHINPVWILQPIHPAEDELPVSHVSVPTTIPSPHKGTQIPCELAVKPAVAQVMHWFADLQVWQDPPQAWQPWLESKYYPVGQLIGWRINFWQTP